MYAIKTEDFYEDFSKDIEIFHFSSYSAKSRYYADSNKVVVGKIKDESVDAVEDFFRLMRKMYLFLVEDSS